jgi:hypothetical protein
MKTFFLDFMKKLSRWRDILLVLLVAAGAFFFVQKGQAVKLLDPDEIWQKIWIEQVPPQPEPEDQLGPDGQPVPKKALNAPSHASDIFKVVPLKDIEAISSNPIWTPAGDYTQLRARLESLKKDYQDATTAGDTKTAREKLVQYCKDDPAGRILQWPNPPQTILTNLVCEQNTQDLSAAIEAARTANQSISSGDQNADLVKTLDSLGQAHAALKQAVDTASANPECITQAQGTEARLADAKSLLDSIGQARDGISERLVKQEFDTIIRDGGAVTDQTDAAAVAQLLERIRKFRDLQKSLDATNTIIDQPKLDRLQEVQTKVESGKDARITAVRQQIQTLAGTENLQENRDILNQILGLFDTLEKLGDPKANSDRRQYDGYIQKIEAASTVQEINTLLDEAEKDLATLKTQIEAKQDSTELVKKLTDSLDKLDTLRKKPSVRRAPGGTEAGRRATTVLNEWKRVRQKLRQE